MLEKMKNDRKSCMREKFADFYSIRVNLKTAGELTIEKQKT